MGCDIHGVFQRKVNDQWEDVNTTYDCDRDYNLFTILAGVRSNGRPMTPIAQPRGLPDDFRITAYVPGPDSEDDPEDYDDTYHPVSDISFLGEWRQKYFNEREDMLALWMGDHSYSWLTSTEMLAWRDVNSTMSDYGVVPRNVYEKWDKSDAPSNWCGWIGGPGILIIDDTKEAKEANPNWSHIRCVWNQSLNHQDYFFDEVRRLHNEHGEVRFVFGFDS